MTRNYITEFTAITYVAGTCIGSGIYSSPGKVVVNAGSGGAALLVWVLAAFVAAAGGLCYAEVGQWYEKKQGGEAMFVRELWGDVAGFCFIWVSALVTKPATTAIICSIFGDNLNAALSLPTDTFLSNLPALLGMLSLAMLNAYSASHAATLQRIVTVIKVICIIGLVLAIIPFLIMSPSGTDEDVTDDMTTNNTFPPVYVSNMGFAGTSDVVGDWGEAFLNALWAYDGWVMIAYIVVDLKKTENSNRVVLLGIALVAGLYVALTSAYTMMLPIEQAGSDTIVVEYLSAMFGEEHKHYGKVLGAVIVTISTFGSCNGSLYSIPRIVQHGSNSSYLPHYFGFESKRNTPQRAIFCQCLFAALFIIFIPFEQLLLYFGSATYIFYSMVAGGLLYKRLNKSAPHTEARVSLAYPVFFIAFSAILVLSPLVKRTAPTVISYVATASGIPLFFLLPQVRRATHRIGCCLFAPEEPETPSYQLTPFTESVADEILEMESKATEEDLEQEVYHMSDTQGDAKVSVNGDELED